MIFGQSSAVQDNIDICEMVKVGMTTDTGRISTKDFLRKLVSRLSE